MFAARPRFLDVCVIWVGSSIPLVLHGGRSCLVIRNLDGFSFLYTFFSTRHCIV